MVIRMIKCLSLGDRNCSCFLLDDGLNYGVKAVVAWWLISLWCDLVSGLASKADELSHIGNYEV